MLEGCDSHNARLIRSAMRGHPQMGLRCFISTTARIRSWSGPFGPGFDRRLGENSNRYLRCTRARWKFKRVDGLNVTADRSRRFGWIKVWSIKAGLIARPKTIQ